MSAFWSNSTLQYWTALIGTLFLFYYLTAGLRFTYGFVRPSRLHKYQHSGSTSWACVTGGSDGIGLAFAQELLASGFNKVEIVVADASQYDDSYSVVVEKINSLPGKLTVLVNNVGGIHTKPQYVAHSEIAHADIDTAINVNARFATHLIRDLIPILRANGPALLANVGSVGGILGVPYITTYSATKAYIHVLSESLKNEMVPEGITNIDVASYTVGNVSSHTNTFDMPFTITSRECAASCLRKSGSNSDAMLWVHWKHVIPAYIAMLLPKSIGRVYLGDEMKKRVEQQKKSG